MVGMGVRLQQPVDRDASLADIGNQRIGQSRGHAPRRGIEIEDAVDHRPLHGDRVVKHMGREIRRLIKETAHHRAGGSRRLSGPNQPRRGLQMHIRHHELCLTNSDILNLCKFNLDVSIAQSCNYEYDALHE